MWGGGGGGEGGGGGVGADYIILLMALFNNWHPRVIWYLDKRGPIVL